jgi:DNA-binding NtrC family response regulator
VTTSPLDAFLAASPALAASAERFRRAAASRAPILILGEAGTGRSSLARALHAASPRAAGPLVEVDPGALPSSLFESELFGYRPGAFTGAERATPGRVERAAGGTLILDHVEETPLSAQPKLLRLLAEQRYTPLGGSETAADVRLVAVAAEDLRERIARGSFREDLYYRLEVLTFRLPPLRERRQDLPQIIAHLMTDLEERFGRRGLRLAPAAGAWMASHPWPGNLRELRNLLEREVLLAEPGGEGELDPAAPAGGEGRPRSLAEEEADQIRRALAYTRGHQGQAAEILGISRKTLWEKRRRYAIP